MNLIKPRTLSVLHKPHRFKGQDWFVVSPLCVFTLSDTPVVLAETDPRADFNSLIPQQVFDLCMPKGRAEYVIVGAAYSPAGKPIEKMTVAAQVANLHKNIFVVGDKKYRKSLLGLRASNSRSHKFQSIPLSYEYALGGRGSKVNPVGKGILRKRSDGEITGANLFYDEPKVTVSSDTELPGAAFGPVGVDWPAKIDQAGTYNQDWLDNHNPGYPTDIDFTFFNRAAEDQQTTRYFKGGDAFRLEGMHPSQRVICGRLPSIVFRVFVKTKAANAQQELETKIDTVWFFPEQGIGVMVARAVTPVNDCDALDVASLLLAYEHGSASDEGVGGSHSASTRPQSHYDHVLSLRTDRSVALKHVFNESQLTPQKSDFQLEALRAVRRAYHHEQEKKSKELADNLCSLLGGGGDDLKDKSPESGELDVDTLKFDPDSTPTPEEIQSGDFDLSPFIDFTEKAIELAKIEAENTKSKADELILEAAENASKYSDLASSPSPVTNIETNKEGNGSSPLDNVVRLSNELKESENTEQLEALATQISSECEKLNKQHAVADLVAEKPARTDVSLAKRSWVVKLLKTKASIQGLNLSYADLSQLDFSGKDLSGCDFSETDLSGASLRGCGCKETVFYRSYAVDADFSHAQFSSTNMSGLNACKALFSGAKFDGGQWNNTALNTSVWQGAKLENTHFFSVSANSADFTRAVFNSISLVDSSFRNSQFDQAKFNNINVTKCDIAEASFNAVLMSGIAWVESNLGECDFTAARLQKCTALPNCNFSSTKFEKTKVTVCGFGGVDFSKCNFSEGNFHKSDFSNANFNGATLDGASFAFSLLNGVKLSECSARALDVLNGLCRKADFSRSDLTKAQFEGADLFEANFDGAIITGATLSSMAFVSNAKKNNVNQNSVVDHEN